MAFFDRVKATEILFESLKFLKSDDFAIGIEVDSRNEFRYPHPSCVELGYDNPEDMTDHLGITWQIFDITIRSYNDIVQCNEWMLRLARRSSEPFPLSCITILIYKTLRKQMNLYKDVFNDYKKRLRCFTKRHVKYYDMFVKEAPALIRKFDMPFGNECVSFDTVDNFIRASDIYDRFHKTIRCRKIQRCFRLYNSKRHKAASVIQKKWRHVISDPSCRPCKNRMMWEFEGLV